MRLLDTMSGGSAFAAFILYLTLSIDHSCQISSVLCWALRLLFLSFIWPTVFDVLLVMWIDTSTIANNSIWHEKRFNCCFICECNWEYGQSFHGIFFFVSWILGMKRIRRKIKFKEKNKNFRFFDRLLIIFSKYFRLTTLIRLTNQFNWRFCRSFGQCRTHLTPI